MGAADDFIEAASASAPRGTTIFAPDGTVVAEAAAGEETIVYGDLDLGRIAEEQQSLDVVGHYNRPDVFDLRVDASSRRPVTWKRSPAQTYAGRALGALRRRLRPDRRSSAQALMTTTPAITSRRADHLGHRDALGEEDRAPDQRDHGVGRGRRHDQRRVALRERVGRRDQAQRHEDRRHGAQPPASSVNGFW